MGVDEAEENQDADVFPDENTCFDDVGPFAEEPSQEQEERPEKAISGWDNETALKAAAGSFDSWGRSFCSAHRVGTFCDQFTQVRCCKASWGAGGWNFDQVDEAEENQDADVFPDENTGFDGWCRHRWWCW